MGGLRRLGGLGGLRVGVVYFSGFYPMIRRLYFAKPSSHTRLRQLADFPSLFLYRSYIQRIG